MTPRLFEKLGRRELFRRGGLLAALGFAPRPAAGAAPSPGVYSAIGVRPLINARGTFTIISGSQSLPEVKRTMEEASRSYVHIDELMNGVGKRLAEITRAEWGIVTAGCAAAMTHTTAACIAGSNPERMQRLPDLAGLKSEVIIPAYSRNVYDHAIRMLGVKVVEVSERSKLESAFSNRTAMVYILAGPGDEGPLGTATVAAAAKRYKVPVLVDAAAENLTIPSIHLQRGATAVAYSGGKCIRGPQCAGLLLGEKSLLQAAWANSAPHHAFGRSLKVGKEEIMGMLAAVEAWPHRNHDAEWRRWESWLDVIASRVKQVNGVTTEVVLPDSLSNHTPNLRIQWDPARLGISGAEVAKILFDTEPRIALAWGNANAVMITPYMMFPGDERVVGDRLHAVLAAPPKIDRPAAPQGELASIDGQWELEIHYARGSALHSLVFEQQGMNLVGTHQGEFLSGDLKGTVRANEVQFESSHKIEGTRLFYNFQGKTTGGQTMEGTVDLGEYGEARWVAKRHEYVVPGGVVKPVKTPI